MVYRSCGTGTNHAEYYCQGITTKTFRRVYSTYYISRSLLFQPDFYKFSLRSLDNSRFIQLFPLTSVSFLKVLFIKKTSSLDIARTNYVSAFCTYARINNQLRELEGKLIDGIDVSNFVWENYSVLKFKKKAQGRRENSIEFLGCKLYSLSRNRVRGEMTDSWRVQRFNS